MKLYCFYPNTYSQVYFVMSENPDTALASLKVYLKQEVTHDTHSEDVYNRWKDVTLSSLPEKYTLEDYAVGEVVQTEIS